MSTYTRGLPESLSVHMSNIYDNIPQHLVGAYDVIHPRFFISIIRNNDAGPIVRDLSKMLSMLTVH